MSGILQSVTTKEVPQIPQDTNPNTEGIQFDFGEDGTLQFTNVEEAINNAFDEVQAETGQPSGELSEQQALPPQSPSNDRVSALENQLGQVTQLMTAFIQNQNQRGQQVQEPELDDTDPQSVQNYINQSIQSAVAKLQQPIQQSIHDQQRQMLEMQFQTASAKYGDDFNKKLPLIGVLIKSDPNLSFDQAYQMIKQSIGEPAKQHSPAPVTTTQPRKTVVNASEVATRAAKLSTENGVTAEQSKPSHYKTPKEAFEAALEQVLATGR